VECLLTEQKKHLSLAVLVTRLKKEYWKQTPLEDGMKEISIRLKKTDSIALFHDSRGDARVMAKALNIAIGKINELVAEVNQLKELVGSSRGG